MATLVLYGNEKLEDIVTEDGETGRQIIYFDDINLVLHKAGDKTKILKSPHDEN